MTYSWQKSNLMTILTDYKEKSIKNKGKAFFFTPPIQNLLNGWKR